jgi:hypothetical protein
MHLKEFRKGQGLTVRRFAAKPLSFTTRICAGGVVAGLVDPVRRPECFSHTLTASAFEPSG